MATNEKVPRTFEWYVKNNIGGLFGKTFGSGLTDITYEITRVYPNASTGEFKVDMQECDARMNGHTTHETGVSLESLEFLFGCKELIEGVNAEQVNCVLTSMK